MRRDHLLLILFSLTLFAFVAVQAYLRQANGNWAAPAFVAGTVLAVPWLVARAPKWAVAGLLLNAPIAVALPLSTVWPEQMTWQGRQLFERTQGVRELSEAVLARARADGLTAVAAADRMILADLVYRSKGTDIDVFAWPVPEPPDSHYTLTRPLQTQSLPVLFVGGALPAACVEAFSGAEAWSQERGSARVRDVVIARLEAPCAP